MPGLLWPAVIYALILALHLALPGALGRRLRARPRQRAAAALPPQRPAGAGRRRSALCVVRGRAGLARRGTPSTSHRWRVAAGACVLGLLVHARRSCCRRRRGGRSLLGRPVPRAAGEPAVARRPRRRQDVPLPGRRGHARAERAVVRRPPRAAHPAIPRRACSSTPRSSASSSPSTCSSRRSTSTPTTSSPSASASSSAGAAWCSTRSSTRSGCGRRPSGPNPHTPALAARRLSRSLFFAGWMLARGANLQKFQFKRDPERALPRPARRRVTLERRAAGTCCAAASGGSRATSTTWARS